MDFNGEHLLPGRLGHLFLILSFVSSIGATVCYFLSVQKSRRIDNPANLVAGNQWKKLASQAWKYTEFSIAFL